MDLNFRNQIKKIIFHKEKTFLVLFKNLLLLLILFNPVVLTDHLNNIVFQTIFSFLLYFADFL